MFKLEAIRWYCRCEDLKGYDDLNFFQRIIFKIRLKKALKKDSEYCKMRESFSLPDMNFNEYISRYFNV